MAERVKSKRRYNSPRRREQAAETRREILEAAQRLFEQQGYALTTMAAIATEAPHPESQLRLTARNSRIVKQRAGALMGVIRNAAPADPDIEALWSRIQSDFYDNQRSIVEALDRKRA